MTYRAAQTFLGTRDRRKLANNTYLVRDGRAISVQLHGTQILTFRPDGTVEVDTGGWETPTTRNRLNLFLPLPWRIVTERGVWKIEPGAGILVQCAILLPHGKWAGLKPLPPPKLPKPPKRVHILTRLAALEG